MLRILPVVIVLGLLVGCGAQGYDQQPQSQSSQPAAPVLYPPGEYLTTLVKTPAANTAVDFALAIKAIGRNDVHSAHVLYSDGLLFNLPKGTMVALLPAKDENGEPQASAVVGTVSNIHICIATVESGDRIGNKVALGCDGLSLDK